MLFALYTVDGCCSIIVIKGLLFALYTVDGCCSIIVIKGLCWMPALRMYRKNIIFNRQTACTIQLQTRSEHQKVMGSKIYNVIISIPCYECKGFQAGVRSWAQSFYDILDTQQQVGSHSTQPL